MPRRRLRIGLFLPRPTPFYMSVFHAMRRGFEACGVEVAGCSALPTEAGMREFARAFRPDAIFEMNRTRAELPTLDRRIKHISWICDMAVLPPGELRSEILYFFSPFDLGPTVNSPRWRAALIDALPPGADELFYTDASVRPECDVSFIGHIPKPWSKRELDRTVVEGTTDVRFGDLIEMLGERLHEEHVPLGAVLLAATLYVAEAVGRPFPLMKSRVYDAAVRSVRVLNRQRLIDTVLGVTPRVRIYGPDHWAKYPRYRRLYRKHLDDPSEISHVFRASRLNLHEGVGMHFRALDCMCSGAVLVHFMDAPVHAFDLAYRFEPHVHYVPVTQDDFGETVRRYLRDGAKRRAMGRSAARRVRARHTWTHRARKILTDLSQV